MTEICSLSLTAVAGALQKKEISAVEAARACLTRMEATEPRIAAMLRVGGEGSWRAPVSWTRPGGPGPDALGRP